jgi:hypothetical protein
MPGPGVVKPVLLAAVFTSGCGPKNDPGGEPGGSSTGGHTESTTGDGVSSTPTTSGVPDPTTSTSAANTTTTDTTGEPDDICGDFCGRVLECAMNGEVEECLCANLDTAGPKCVAAWQAARDCFVAASCEEVNTHGLDPCWSAYIGAVDRCRFYGEDGCGVAGLILESTPPGACAFMEDCLDAPDSTLECDAETCTCTREEKTVGTCPADGLCEGNPDLEAKIAECCHSGGALTSGR